MHRFSLLFLALLFSVSLFGKDVSVDQARETAMAFLERTNTASSTVSKSAVPIHLMLVGDLLSKNDGTVAALKSVGSGSPEMYIFTINQAEGFIVMSGDDAAIPVLGYSRTERLDTIRALPENIRYWLEGYRQQIRSLREQQVAPTDYINNLWKGLYETLKVTSGFVLPLVNTQWNQMPYYNDLCPFNEQYQKHTVAGCVATTMAQIMKYWESPSKGVGVHAYHLAKYGNLSADFSSTLYDWASMPVSVTESNEAVATLMYHSGVAVDMQYNVEEDGGSGARSLFSAAYPDRPAAESALVTNFGFSPSLRGLTRLSYSDAEWKSMLRAEFDAGRPVFYSGRGEDYGHAFVCDGYDENSYFHMNWGWGGAFDGYFVLDALNPGTKYTFNLSQQAIMGIRPRNPALEAVLELSGDVATSKSTIDYEEGFTVSGNIMNTGTRTFSGDYCVAIYDEQLFLVDMVNIRTGQSLGAGAQYANGISFTIGGMASMIPGTYRAYLLYRPTGGFWGALSSHNGDLSTHVFAEIEVVHSNEISLYSPMHLASNPAYANDTLSVWLNVQNDSPTDFRGSLLVSLYTLEGNFVTAIEEKNNEFLPSHSHFADSLNFYNDRIPLSPGTYILKLFHRRTGGSYELTGSSTIAINPIKIELLEPLPLPDIYEVNDSVEIAFPLSVTYLSSLARVTTDRANIHSTTDVDFYSLTLDSQYEYTVNAALQDVNVSTNGHTYSLDGLFYYSIDGETWSNSFDDRPTGDLTFSGGTPLYFKVAPWRIGDVGTYLLNIQIQRRITTSVETIAPVLEVTVYPNPFTDYITVSCPEIIQEYQLFDFQGRLIHKAAVNAQQTVIDLSACNNGMYILRIVSGGMLYVKKLIKE